MRLRSGLLTVVDERDEHRRNRKSRNFKIDISVAWFCGPGARREGGGDALPSANAAGGVRGPGAHRRDRKKLALKVRVTKIDK